MMLFISYSVILRTIRIKHPAGGISSIQNAVRQIWKLSESREQRVYQNQEDRLEFTKAIRQVKRKHQCRIEKYEELA